MTFPMRTICLTCIVAIVVHAGPPAWAQTNLITNGDFSSNGGEGSAPTGWTKDFNSYGAFGGDASMPPRTASWMLHAGLGFGTGGEYQEVTTTSGRSYLVTLWAQGWASPEPGMDSLMRQQAALVVGDAGSTTVTLGSTQLATTTAVVAMASPTVTNFLAQGRIAGAMTSSPWYAQGSSFTATSTTTRIGLYNVSVAPYVSAANFDDVGVYAANDWTTDANGDWSTSANWADGTAPNASGAIAAFSGAATAPRTITLDSGVTVGALVFRNANAYTLAGANTLTLSGTYAASTGPMVTVNSGNHTIAAPVVVSGTLAPVFAIDQNTRLTVTGNVSGSAGVVKSGYGTLALTSANTFTGGVVVTGGTLTVQGDPFGFGSIAANQNISIANATLATTGTEFNALTATWTSGTTTINAGGLLYAGNATKNAHNLYDIVLAGGTMASGAGSLNGAVATWYVNGGITATGGITSTISSSLGKVAAGSPLVVAVDPGSTLNVTAPIVNIGGVNGLTKTGAGTLALTGASTFTGGVVVTGGTLTVQGDAFGVGSIAANQNITITNATLATTGNQFNAMSATWTSGTTTINAGGLLYAGNAANNAHSLYDIVLAGGTMASGAGTLGAAVATWYVNGGITATGGTTSTISSSLGKVAASSALAVAVDAGSTLEVTAPIVNIGGANGLTKTGAGTLALTGASTFTGGVVVTGGTLTVQGFPLGIGSIAANQNISIANATLATTGNEFNAMSLTWTSGTTTINAGGLLYAGNAARNAHSLYDIVLAGGTMASGAGSLDGAVATWYVNGGITATGGTTSTISSSLGKVAASSPLAVAVEAGSTLDVTAPIVNIGGANGLTKTGDGTLTLAAATNTFTGNTSVVAGLLLVNGGLPNSAVSVASGATLGGTGTIGGSVSILGGGILSPGASIESLQVGSASLAGTLLIEHDGAGAGSIDLLTVDGALDITSGTLAFTSLGAALDDPAYVFATYGSLVGTQFGSVVDLPSGYTIDYAYGGNSIALVAVPEPATLALGAVAALAAWPMFRRARRKGDARRGTAVAA